MLNKKAKKIIEEIKQIFSTHYVNKEEIKKWFDNYFDLIGLPKRKVEFCENKKGWNAAWDVAWDVAWNAACLNSCDKDDDCKICEFRRKFCEPEFNLFKNGTFIYWILKDKVVVITRPIIRHVGDKLHSETEPAIEWEDEKYYFLWGVRFDKDLWEKVVKKKMSFKEILKIENIEQRMVALKMMDSDKLLKESKARLLDKSKRGNELYLIETIFNRPQYFLRYKDPSTGRIYLSGIDPEFAKGKSADECMAWKFQLKLEEYNLLEVES